MPRTLYSLPGGIDMPNLTPKSNDNNQRMSSCCDTSLVAYKEDEQYKSEEYVWGAVLTKASPIVIWHPNMKGTEEDDDEDLDYVQQTLYLTSILAGADAVDGQRNVIVVNTSTFSDDKEFTIGSVTVGQNEVCSINLKFMHNIKATFKLVKGDGPVSLVGNHIFAINTDQLCLGVSSSDEELDKSTSDYVDLRDKIADLKRRRDSDILNFDSGLSKKLKSDSKDENEAIPTDSDEDEEDQNDDAAAISAGDDGVEDVDSDEEEDEDDNDAEDGEDEKDVVGKKDEDLADVKNGDDSNSDAEMISDDSGDAKPANKNGKVKNGKKEKNGELKVETKA